MVLLNSAVSERIVEMQCAPLRASCCRSTGVPYTRLSPALYDIEAFGVLDKAACVGNENKTINTLLA